jgi:hypothetical protein
MTMIKRDNQDMEMACRYTRLRDKKDNHQADIFQDDNEAYVYAIQRKQDEDRNLGMYGKPD